MAADAPGIEHREDTVYGYRDGMALVMDVYIPQSGRNGAGVLLAVSGGWTSPLDRRRNLLGHPEAWGILPRCLLDAGYVVFAAAHATQPRYSIADLRPDLPRAVRYIRRHALSFPVDGERLGIVGGSSGGHVSLMTALAPPASTADAVDPVDRESSALQAAVAYFPPTDLLNYGATGVTMLEAHGSRRAAPLDFRCFDEAAGRFERVADAEQLRDCLRRNSPIAHVRPGNPPVLLIHGDADELVPLQQSEALRDRLRDAGVTHELVVLPGHGHAWPALGTAQQDVVDWFGRYL